MTDCAIESENVRERERENTQKATHDILWAESDIFLHTHTNTDAKYSAFLLEIERERQSVHERTFQIWERESAFVVFFQTQAHFGGYFVQRTESLQKHITEANSKYHTCYSFINYLCKSKNYKRKTFKKIHHIHSTIARERARAWERAREREKAAKREWFPNFIKVNQERTRDGEQLRNSFERSDCCGRRERRSKKRARGRASNQRECCCSGEGNRLGR